MPSVTSQFFCCWYLCPCHWWCIFEALWEEIKSILAGFHHDPFIITRASKTAIYLPYSFIIAFMGNNLLPHRGDNYLLYILKAIEFCIGVHDVAKNFILNIYMHEVYWIILMKYWKALIYTHFQEPPFQEPIHKGFEDVSCRVVPAQMRKFT